MAKESRSSSLAVHGIGVFRGRDDDLRRTWDVDDFALLPKTVATTTVVAAFASSRVPPPDALQVNAYDFVGFLARFADLFE